MDNLTHTLFAITLGRTPLGRAGRGTTAALVLASNAPDIDIVAAARGGVSYLAWHRGPTHGPLGIVGLGALTGALVWLGRWIVDRRSVKATKGSTDASLGMLVSLATIATLLHVLMDIPTAYGTRFLSPFDWHWFSVDWLPIVDVYLLAALAAGIVIGVASPASKRRVTVIVLTLMAANYGVRAVAHQRAVTVAPRLFGPRLPAACSGTASTGSVMEHWPNAAAAVGSSTRPCMVEIAAVPSLVSPFRWRVIAKLTNGYDLHDLDLLDSRLVGPPQPDEVFWRRSIRFPNQWTSQVTEAAGTRTGRIFLGFSRFPAARSFVDPSGVATVRWSDMRFAGGRLGLGEGPRRADPLSVLIRIAPDGRVLDERFTP